VSEADGAPPVAAAAAAADSQGPPPPVAAAAAAAAAATASATSLMTSSLYSPSGLVAGLRGPRGVRDELKRNPEMNRESFFSSAKHLPNDRKSFSLSNRCVRKKEMREVQANLRNVAVYNLGHSSFSNKISAS